MIYTAAYPPLKAHANQLKTQHLADLFKAEPNRFEAFSTAIEGLLFDYSKQKIDSQALDGLIKLAEERDLSEWIQKLFAGEAINHTESRAAGHTRLRDVNNPSPDVSKQWDRMANIVSQVHQKQLRGYSGKPITEVVNIGVGGSDLGPLMVTHALDKDRHPQAPGIHFVSTLDAQQLQKLLNKLNPETTLFIIASKSFATIDTLSLADTAKAWIQQYAKSESATLRHFIGISTNAAKMAEWGILPDYQLLFWDWVGGRFSLWSAIGLSIALAQGMAGYKSMLAGAQAMDQHFKETPFSKNIPVLMGLIGIWNTNFLELAAQAILPYDSRLKYFASYLEQLEMESNGKSTRRDGTKVTYRTNPILWGEVGPNAQHAFYQLLHQGTERVMSDFILFSQGVSTSKRATFHHQLNVANCLAQSRALMIGQASDDLNKHYPGDQVSSTLLLETLDAHHLGMLIALYEHKVFVQSVIWNINPFDQWGVELGKKLASEIMQDIKSGSTDHLDSSTAGILKAVLAHSTGVSDEN
ncbi:MAG: glucose-6-phosphate isomerase [Gammaproteobacteria bacterium]|nr:glucose-6-phosphate isomerase [Gammaproteobacteria bacterium]